MTRGHALRNGAALVMMTMLAACASPPAVKRLPNWSFAADTKTPSAETPCFDADVVDSSELPEAIPYAVLRGLLDGDRAATAGRLLQVVRRETSPDFAVLHDLGSFDAGTVSHYWGHGMITERRVYERVAELVCWRLAPVSLGFELRPSDGVVLRRPPRERFDGAELLEGDELLTLDGIPLRYGERWPFSPHWKHLATLRVGDLVELVWLRPGEGRMSSRLRVVANDRTWRSLPRLR